MRTPKPAGQREQWQPGDAAWFEYHCLESPESADAPAWYRSHQRVTVLRQREDYGGTATERGEAGCPNVYQVRFSDGLEWDAFEDELLTSPGFFVRPDPPNERGAPAMKEITYGLRVIVPDREDEREVTRELNDALESADWPNAAPGWQVGPLTIRGSAPDANPAGEAGKTEETTS
jgi:hypothetical protein